MLHRQRVIIVPKAMRFINALRGRTARKTLQCPVFFFYLPEISGSLHVYSTMKLHATETRHYQTVTAYDDNGVEINAVRYSHSLIVLPETIPAAWGPASFENLNADHFAQIAATEPDVVILGTGARQRFVHPRLIQALTERRLGVECMDNQAACRTYNILMAEGRKVALALIFEQSAAS
jgi:uncharacterized protein